MGLTARLLAAGVGWRASDVVCSSGPRDRPFEEEHDGMCIAAVTHGTFQYRSTRGSAVLAPGAILLGNNHEGLECGHDHSTGDRCLSFHLTQEFLEEITAELGEAREPAFHLPSLPPLKFLTPLLAEAQVARDEADATQLEELAVRIAVAVAATLRGTPEGGRPPTASDARRVSDVLRWIEQHIREPLTLRDVARRATMSRYHFLGSIRVSQ